MEYAWLPGHPPVAVAWMVKLKNPGVLGVPVMAPVALLSVSPVGSEPDVIEYVYGAVPPLAEIV